MASEVFTVDKAMPMTRRANYTKRMKDSLANNAYIAGYDAEVSSVAVMDGDKILLGKRRDNGKWTLPGGHLNPGEDPHTGGLRELFEESGIQAQQLITLGSRGIVTDQGKFIMVHAYCLTVSPKTTTKIDPDQEIVSWRWFNTANGLPKNIEQNLHVTRNFVLHCMGIQKSLDKSATFGNRGEGSRGGHVVRYTRSGKPVYADVENRINKNKKKKPKLADSLIGAIKAKLNHLKSFVIDADPVLPEWLFVIDMLKSLSHKYLRKYKAPNGEWVYIYHEGNARGRVIPEEAIKRIKKLAELGDSEAHSLHSTMQEHNPRKLDILRELADLGDEDAKKHLGDLGIDHAKDREQRDSHEVEQALLAERNSNPLTKRLEGAELDKLHKIINDTVDSSIFGYLAGHASMPTATALAGAGVTLPHVMAPVSRATSIKEALDALHESLKAVDRAHTGVVSQNQDANNNGGYGNLAYNRTLTALKNAHMIPEAMVTANKRTVANRTGSNPVDAAQHAPAARQLATQRAAAEAEAERRRQEQQRAETERQAAQERLRREEQERMAATERELAGSMALHIASLYSRSLSVDEVKGLHQTLGRIFNGNMRKEDWPYDFSSSGYKVKITGMRVRTDSITFEMHATNAAGESVTSGWTRDWNREQGGAHIHNSYLHVNAEVRGASVPISGLINKSQIKLLKKLDPQKGRITVQAACDVGGYQWANQGFSFFNSDTATRFREQFIRFLKDTADIRMTDEDAKEFKMPVHFASFDDGRLYEHAASSLLKLSAKQKATGTLDGKVGGVPLTSREISDGKTMRMMVHLGKLFLLTGGRHQSRSWYGEIKVKNMEPGNEAYEHFMNYDRVKTEAWKHLNAKYVRTVADVTNQSPVPSLPFGSNPATAPPKPRRPRRPRST